MMKKLEMDKKIAILVFITILICSIFICLLKNNNLREQSVQKSGIELTTYNSDSKLYKEKIKSSPRRVIAIWQTSVETLIALGQSDKIIAAIGLPDDKCLKESYRDAYQRIPYKSFNRLNQEAAIAMKPDFILTSWASSFNSKNIGRTDFWNERNIGTYISEIPPAVGGKRTIEHEYKYIRDMGRLFGVEDRAETIINEIEEKISKVTKRLPADNKQYKKVMIIQFMGSKLKNWGSDYLQGDIVTKLHGDLVIKDSMFIGYEDLLVANPEIIFLMATEWEYNNLSSVYDKICADRRFASLSAVKNKRIYIVPLYLGQYSAVRLGEGIELFAKGMYPELY